MKYAFLFLFGGAFLFTIVLIGLSVRSALELEDCTNQSARQIETNLEKIQTETTIHHQLCTENKRAVSALKLCYQDTRKESLIPINWVDYTLQKIQPGKPSAKELIHQHNLYCPEHRVNYIIN